MRPSVIVLISKPPADEVVRLILDQVAASVETNRDLLPGRRPLRPGKDSECCPGPHSV